jgi:hypothetical protein
VVTWSGMAAPIMVSTMGQMPMPEAKRLTGSAAQKLKIKSITMVITITTENTLTENNLLYLKILNVNFQIYYI